MPKKSHEITEAKPFLSREVQREFTEDDFDFENLALEGGGSSAMAYVGAIRVGAINLSVDLQGVKRCITSNGLV